MRIVRFLSPDGRTLVGTLLDEHTASPIQGDLFGAHAFSKESVRIERLLSPVLPPNIFAIGRNYKAHAEETGSRIPEQPLIFLKATSSLLDPGGLIRIPPGAPSEVDFEAELAIVIGRTARRVGETEAFEYVLGYTCANDVSARDCQRNDKQWARAKGFDTFCPLGPWIVTRDALDPDHCTVQSRVNGKVMQNSNTRNMLHNCRKLISYVSHQFTLHPGTVILTGTPEGVGMARNPPVFLKAGDLVEIEIGGIGVLSNRVAGD